MERLPKVMIVDDDRNSTSLLKTLLEMDGFEVMVVPRGTEAMSKAQQFSPDAFVVDYHLNDMSGVDLVSELRASVDFSNTPIVMASGRDVGQQAEAAGANLFLIKPYDPNLLSEHLMSLLS